jgi:hypothetical protein
MLETLVHDLMNSQNSNQQKDLLTQEEYQEYLRKRLVWDTSKHDRVFKRSTRNTKILSPRNNSQESPVKQQNRTKDNEFYSVYP